MKQIFCDNSPWAPKAALPEPVVQPGDFSFAAAFFEHAHIYGQTEGLAGAGANCKWAWDPDPQKLDAFCRAFPSAKRARCFEEILEDPEVKLVTAAGVPSERAEVGFAVMESGKDYFVDKAPFTTLEQLEAAKAMVEKTGQKYCCDFSERVHTEAGYYAGELIQRGAIGRVLQILILAPHNLAKASRPGWFFQKEKYGGILTDIGSHQFEQFLSFASATDGAVNFARVDNFANPDTPELEDFGEASITTQNGVSCYCRLDWFNPRGLRNWGDGRTFILGTEGTIEVRKYIELAAPEKVTDTIYLIDHQGEHRIPCEGRVGFPFYNAFVLDCLNRTENVMTHAHAFKSTELSMQAQAIADKARPTT